MFYRAFSLVKVLMVGLFMVGAVRAQSVALSDLQEISLEMQGKSVAVFCYNGQAGAVRVRGELVKFIAYATKIKTLRKKGQRGSKKFKNLLKLNRAANKACKALGVSPGDVPGTNEPIQTPNPTDYYDDQLNLTELGKQAFGVPVNLNPSYVRGASKFSSMCQGCHGKNIKDTLVELRSAVSSAPMNFSTSELPDSDLADILTYLKFGTCALCR